ncbi:cobyrinate a,c-diamide synthase [Aeromicrobium piscarium]|uniref:Hydrogenobyrinate a,c-diamide synthase n=1 Tax=Aeromicrobium piscarium TaxID=2590901 RepID=A0A554S840_9ACTN|nr:cobyrinate a,c-diamide synthase [Aeromicrobium piscarium]TSD62494.1 cobyrinate a,c-diamide synthase [Aeromicrobium piscarium]
MVTSLPRVVIAAPASGHGKTTVATGLMAALRHSGRVVSGHKVGPDYIDPGYHSLATGRPGRNLDPRMVGEERIVPLLLHGAAGADLAVIEGVMGLFDGQIGGQGFASTAHVAALTDSPIVLVVDASHASRSIGALVAGMRAFDPAVTIAGVIVNKVGSDRHAGEVVDAIDAPVLGVISRDDGIVAPSRHLGLVPMAERDDAAAALDRLSERIARTVDLSTVADIARAAPPLEAEPWTPPVHTPSRRPRIAVAGGRAFTFRYAETEELLAAAGAELVGFDPLEDRDLPAGIDGLYLGGGFPEVHAGAIAANAPMRAAVRAAVRDGVPTVAECAGLLYLCRTLDGAPMAGAIEADAQMTGRLTLAYRQAVAPHASVLGPAGTTVIGHEFHRTQVTPGHGEQAAWTFDDRPAGFASTTLHASYLHTHWAGTPDLARAFVTAAASHTTREPVEWDVRTAKEPVVPSKRSPKDSAALRLPQALRRAPCREVPPGRYPHTQRVVAPSDPLRHHGDVEAVDGAIDFAVNVSSDPRPEWLTDALVLGVTRSDRYPDARPAARAIAHHLARPVEEILPSAGAAEVFGLVARLRPWRQPVIVHPQFTEPDVALRMAGHEPTHVLLPGPDFALATDAVPEDADLVFIGNPTNPTGRLHRIVDLERLRRPGRLVVVDEAFMDALPGEPESLASRSLPGVLVVRSLTKLWAMPGIRAGFATGPAEVIAALRDLQAPWSVSSPAVEAMIACHTPEAAAEARARASRIARDRAVLTDGLSELGVPFSPSDAPFVLARVGTGVHGRLAAAGYAVRRADTFPGLDGQWVRIAVRPPALTRKLLTALRIELS